jgi:acetyltransferase-like isoleucine patch superfamily enzyme
MFMAVNRVRLGIWRRGRAALFLLPAMLSPASRIRVFFHRMRGVRIGHDVEIGYMVMIDNLYPHKVAIRDGATVTYGCTIVAHDESKRYARSGEEIVKEVEIGPGAFIGMNSTVLPGARIGAGAIVGACTLVNKDVPPGSTVVGAPFRHVGKK